MPSPTVSLAYFTVSFPASLFPSFLRVLYTITAPGNKYFQYHTTFTSMKETFGYKTPEAWFAHLREWKEELAHPVTVRIKDNRTINRVETNTTKQKLRGIYQFFYDSAQIFLLVQSLFIYLCHQMKLDEVI